MRFVPRRGWMPPGWRLPGQIARTSHLWVHHGAAGRPTLATLQSYDRYHRSLGWAMLGYSWAVTADGTIYEGRGWGRAGAHTVGWNTRSHAIVLVGDWSSGTVPQAMIDACGAIVRHGIRVGALTSNVRIGGHREAPGNSTSCPGAAGMRALPAIRNAAASARPQPPPPERSWFELATQRDLERAVRNVINDLFDGDTSHDERLKEVAAAVRGLAPRVRSAAFEKADSFEDAVWISTNDVDEGISLVSAAVTNSVSERFRNSRIDGWPAIIIGAAGNEDPADIAADGAAAVIIQGQSRQQTAAATAAYLQRSGVNLPQSPGTVWIADGDVDEGIAMTAAEMSGGEYRRWSGEPVRGSHVAIVGALGSRPVEEVAPGADRAVILQGATRAETAEAVARFLHDPDG